MPKQVPEHDFDAILTVVAAHPGGVPERAYIDGVLGIYELNRVELLRDVFVWAYERSSALLGGAPVAG